MQTLILTLHIIVCFLLVILILLQSGKEGMGVIFGGGNSSVFGSTGAGGILAKLTTLMAIIFVITSLSYTYVTSSRPTSESSILNVKIEDTPPAAVAPAPQSLNEPAAVNRQDGAATDNAPGKENMEKPIEDGKKNEARDADVATQPGLAPNSESAKKP